VIVHPDRQAPIKIKNQETNPIENHNQKSKIKTD
jgi:hypothetical protein